MSCINFFQSSSKIHSASIRKKEQGGHRQCKRTAVVGGSHGVHHREEQHCKGRNEDKQTTNDYDQDEEVSGGRSAFQRFMTGDGAQSRAVGIYLAWGEGGRSGRDNRMEKEKEGCAFHLTIVSAPFLRSCMITRPDPFVGCWCNIKTSDISTLVRAVKGFLPKNHFGNK